MLRTQFAESYTVEGCSNPAHCGVFRRVDAHCTDTTYGHCPGGAYANGNDDETKCDGVPVYQKVGEDGAVDGSGPVLFQYYLSGSTWWYVCPSDALADCTNGGRSIYLVSQGSNQGPTGGAPTAPSARRGWNDYDNGENGAPISVTAGGGGGGGGH
eukprot:COSAG06_NODE_2997_length_5980_cov_65.382928_2_plen_156_part_00